MKAESPLKKLVVPAAVLPFLAPMAAMAAEGTGRVSVINLCCNVVHMVYCVQNISISLSTLTNKILHSYHIFIPGIWH